MLCRLEEQLRPKTGNSLVFFYHFVLSYMYLTVITIAIFAHKRSATFLFSGCRCCKDECCVGSRRRYGLKWGFPWNFYNHLILSYVYLTVITITLLTHIRSSTCSFSRSVLCKCCKGGHFFGSRSSYILKQGISCTFLKIL